MLLLPTCVTFYVSPEATLAITFYKNPKAKLQLWNSQPLWKKTAYLVGYSCELRIDIFAVKSTRLWKMMPQPNFTRLQPGTRCFPPQDLTVKEGAGLWTGPRMGLCGKFYLCQPSSFEICKWSLLSDNFRMRLCVQYRLPYSSNNPISISTFMIKFTVYIEIVLLSAELLLIHGDFKIHTAVHDDSNCVPFKDLLDSTGLQKKWCEITDATSWSLENTTFLLWALLIAIIFFLIIVLFSGTRTSRVGPYC